MIPSWVIWYSTYKPSSHHRFSLPSFYRVLSPWIRSWKLRFHLIFVACGPSYMIREKRRHAPPSCGGVTDGVLAWPLAMQMGLTLPGPCSLSSLHHGPTLLHAPLASWSVPFAIAHHARPLVLWTFELHLDNDMFYGVIEMGETFHFWLNCDFFVLPADGIQQSQSPLYQRKYFRALITNPMWYHWANSQCHCVNSRMGFKKSHFVTLEDSSVSYVPSKDKWGPERLNNPLMGFH